MADPGFKPSLYQLAPRPPAPGQLADTAIDLPPVDVTATALTPPPPTTTTVQGNNDQWLRKWTLTLTTASGGQIMALTTETPGFDLRMKFEIRRLDNITPNTAVITVYNLKDDTAMNVIREFSKVNIQAGYMTGHYGTIFEGTIVQFRKGRESAIDSYLIIYAADGDIATRYTMVNTVLPAGWKRDDARDAIIKSFKEHGVTPGKIAKDPNGGVKNARPYVMYGVGVDEVESYTKSTYQTWSIQDGKIQVVPITAYLPGDIVVINVGTGMIGIPEVTESGIEVTCLLNPNLWIKGRVQLDNRTFNMFFAPGKDLSGLHGQTTGFPDIKTAGPSYANTADDGIYCIVAISHIGDTRGLEWYTRLVCWAVDPSQLQGSVKGQKDGANV